MTLDEFFDGWVASRLIFDAIIEAVGALDTAPAGPLADGEPVVEVRVTKSQVAFGRRDAFAWAWIPDRYLRGEHAPLVLSISLPERDTSPRWKQVVEPSPGRFMHHLELWSPEDVDAEVRGWLHAAWEAAE